MPLITESMCSHTCKIVTVDSLFLTTQLKKLLKNVTSVRKVLEIRSLSEHTYLHISASKKMTVT